MQDFTGKVMLWIFGMVFLGVYTELCYLGYISYYPKWMYIVSMVYAFGGFVGLIAWRVYKERAH